jgi:hypothetical protein
VHLTLRALLLRAADTWRHPRSRAQELAELRVRWALAPGPERQSTAQVARGRRLAELRDEMAAALGSVEACAACGRGQPLPHGRWEGGFCCAGRTEELFDDAEVAALKAAGVDGLKLRAPAGDHAGCAFRGPTGCSLSPRQRPSRCLAYLCSGLRLELGRRGDLPAVQALADDLTATMADFAHEHERSSEEAAWRTLEAQLLRDLGPTDAGA